MSGVAKPDDSSMSGVTEPDDGATMDLTEGLDGLRDRSARLSARYVLTPRQRIAFLSGALIVGLTLVLWPMPALRVVIAAITVVYAAAISLRMALIWAASRDEHRAQVSDDDALAIPEDELPLYTVLVPAYHEPQVIGQLMDHLAMLDYPASALDVKLLLEADDEQTIEAARAALPGPHVQLVIVPPTEPRTKPKACNHGLQLARGELVTIYDAEDRPEPLQLRRAVVAFRRLGPEYVCLQAELAYFNTDQNRITRWFTLDYATWFRYLLPGLFALGMPIPLGGTSNHFRVGALRGLGGWDAYNVTEDADLGIRLARTGYRVAVLDSVTLEEANSDFINWVKQRSRWYKGYLVTWLVHMRAPRQTARQLGWRGLLCLHLFIAGTPLLALVNPIFWAMTILWFLARPAVIQELFVGPFYYVGLLCMVLGNASVLYLNVLTVRQVDRPRLLGSALLSPAYWVMMSLAGAKAALQLVLSPAYWEKTTHGLHLPQGSAAGTEAAHVD